MEWNEHPALMPADEMYVTDVRNIHQLILLPSEELDALVVSRKCVHHFDSPLCARPIGNQPTLALS